MKKEIIKKWIAELKKFNKEPDYRHLRFPMWMESAKGDLLSPEGILCKLHAAEHPKAKWLPEKPEKKGQLRGYLTYFGKNEVAPQEVLDWAEIMPAQMSIIRSQNGEGGFEKVISYLEAEQL